MQHNLPLTTATVLMVGLIVWLVFYLENKRPSWTFQLRKVLHIVVIFLSALASWFLPPMLVVVVSWFATVGVFIAIRANRFTEVSDNGKARKPWGMLYFCIIYALLNTLIFLVTDKTHPLFNTLRLATVFAFLVLALADGTAGFFGRLVSKNEFLSRNQWNKVSLGNDEKSWFGFFIFCVVTLITSAVFLQCCDLSVRHKLMELVLFSILLATIEMVSSGGSDNLFVSLVAWLFAMVVGSGMYLNGYYELFYQSDEALLVYLVLSVAAAILLVKMGWLNPSGAAMAWILALAVQYMALWPILPLVFFLGFATLVGKLRKKQKNSGGDEKMNKPRDHWQVLANGGLFLFFAVLSYLYMFGFFQSLFELFPMVNVHQLSPMFGEICFFLAMLTLSVSSADTMSSELGQWLGGTPRSVLTGKLTNKGVSGGVTLVGFLGAILGSAAVAVCLYCFEPYENKMVFNLSRVQGFWVLVFFGVMGTVIDSVLGEAIQAKYKNAEGAWSDQPWPGQNPSQPQKGFAAITNDIVNTLTGLISVLIAIIYLLIL
jgi:uncharacterized membrane protein